MISVIYLLTQMVYDSPTRSKTFEQPRAMYSGDDRRFDLYAIMQKALGPVSTLFAPIPKQVST
jgi:hypothetical protein